MCQGRYRDSTPKQKTRRKANLSQVQPSLRQENVHARRSEPNKET